MRATLTPHPDFPAPAIEIEAEAERSGAGRLWLGFRLWGDIAGLRLPPPARAARAEDLWRHTCFEAFVAPRASPAYWEINLSPSSQWATYRFDGYRQGMTPSPVEAAPWGLLLVTDAELSLRTQIDLDGAPELAGPWRLGLTAVIEAADGSFSYWSLAHPPGRPDFHHRDCLAGELAAPQGA